jgi:hypothetical protein
MPKPTYCLSVFLLLLAAVLAACSGDGSEMRAQLEELERQNREYEDFTTDSLAKELVDYFDRHGTANERLRAHYILGCVYRDLGEAPRAVDTYLDAASQADTTAADCDFRTLGCVYAQMGAVLHRQLLLSNEIEARRKSYHYAMIAADTLGCLTEMKFIVSAYILLNKQDSAENLLKETLRLYDEYGYAQQGIQASLMLMHVYIEQPEHLADLGDLICRYDAESKMFDEYHELPPSKRQYYYYKGRYFENIGELDSAEYYYRKIYRPNMAFVSRSPLYQGLLSVFKKRHQADSIAKYAQLYCMVNDSAVVVNDQQLTAQMAASYNYHLYQKEALQNAEKSYRATISLIIISILSVIILLVASYLIYRYKKNHMKLQEAYNLAVSKRKELQEELDSLKALNDSSLVTQKEEQLEGQDQKIAVLDNLRKKIIAKDKLSAFEMSDIVQLFQKKKSFKKENPSPDEDQWTELVSQFRQDMPSVYTIMTSGSLALSDRQLKICILLLLDYDESIIAAMLGSKPQTINTAKVRANEKLFHVSDSASLKANLRQLIAH